MDRRKRNTAKHADEAPRHRREPFIERNAGAILTAILLLALALRLAALADMGRSVYGGFLLWDESIYHVWASKIASGTYESRSVYEFSPLPAYLMAGIYRLLSPDIFYVKLLNALFGVLSCWLIYLIAEHLAGRTAGIIAALLAALCKEMIFFSIVPLKTSLSVLLFATTVFLLIPVLGSGTLLHAFGLGTALGLLVNVRPNCAFLVFVIPLLMALFFFRTELKGWRARRRFRCEGTEPADADPEAATRPPARPDRRLQRLMLMGALFAAGLVLTIGPFMIRNYRAAGVFALTTSQSGFNLYLANDLSSPGPYYRPVPFAVTSPFEQGIQFTIEASRRTGRKLSSWEASRYWTAEVLRSFKERPADFTWKLAQKAVVFCQTFQPANMYYIDFLKDYVPFFKIPLPDYKVILPLAAAGMALTVCRSPAAFSLVAVFLLYAGTLVVYFTTHRYRLPLFAVLIPFLAWGLLEMRTAVRVRRISGIVLYASVAVLFVIVQAIPLPGKGDMTGYYNTHAINLMSRGFEAEAALYWEKSSRASGRYSPFADLSLAVRQFRKGHPERGHVILDRIPDDSFAAPSKYELMGDLMTARSDSDGAIALYRKALTLNSGLRSARMKLVELLKRKNPVEAAEEQKRLQYILSFYDVV